MSEHSSNPVYETPAESRRDVIADILKVEADLNDLRILYEQFFTGAIKFAPEKEHQEMQRAFRRLLRAPLRNAELNFRVRSLKYRFNTFETYWKRVLKEKEEGRYHKDVFKARHRKAHAVPRSALW